LMRNKTLSRDRIYQIAKEKNVDIAIVYDHWFIAYGGLPPEWKKIGERTLQRNVNVAGSTVSFYAVNPKEADNLEKNLKSFEPELPKDIIQSGKYVSN